MKKVIILNFKNTFQILLVLLLTNQAYAQNCEAPNSKDVLGGNNISAIIQANGDLFWDLTTPGFIVPNNLPPGSPQLSTIFSSKLILGAIDDQGEIKVAKNTSDYIAGPINGNPDDCNNFDLLWEVLGSDIQQHISDFEDNGIIDNPILSIFNYPAYQNQYFVNTYGFALPNEPHGLAPFFDENGDGIYDPNVGDFPLPNGVDKNTIPSHILWGIYNDNSPNNNNPLNVEIQLTAWSLDCSGNDLLSNTIFTSYKIVNGGTETLNSMFAGLWMDMDIGCYTDDYLGCIPERNTFYGYNKDALDGTSGCQCNDGQPTYCQVVPAQAITFLNRDLSSFLPYSSNICPSNPSSTEDYYNVMNGLYANGSPMTIGGTGCDGNEPTNFAFPDNPNDAQGWSMVNNISSFADYRLFANTSIGSLPPGAVTTLDIGYSFHQDENLDHLEIVDEMYNQIPILQQLYNEQFKVNCSVPVSTSEVEISTSSVEVFPIPTTHLLNVNFDKSTSAKLSIFDVYGKNVFQTNIENQNNVLSLENLPSGIYFLNIKKENKTITQKFIKQ